MACCYDVVLCCFVAMVWCRCVVVCCFVMLWFVCLRGCVFGWCVSWLLGCWLCRVVGLMCCRVARVGVLVCWCVVVV